MKARVRILSKELGCDIMPCDKEGNGLVWRYEEQASLWLWAYPELLGWDREIKWLFSPVVGKKRFPGDLWGIDSRSSLILVETKLAKARNSAQNPFEDFVPFEMRSAKRLSTEIIQRRWESLLKDEMGFLEQHREDIEDNWPNKGRFPGVVPYSKHRHAVWDWRRVYLEVIVPQLQDSTSYAARIREYLAKRKRNSPIHYFGIVAVAAGSVPRLSPTGIANYDKLRRQVGKSRAHFHGIEASYTRDKRVAITMYRYDPQSEVTRSEGGTLRAS
jgi:hypothetical protein